MDKGLAFLVVPAWETAARLGHKSRDYRTTDFYAAFRSGVFAERRLRHRSAVSFAPVGRRSCQRPIVHRPPVRGRSI